MNIESYRDYCLTKPGVTEGFPFDNRTLVFKVMGKMFALTDIEDFESVNLKCKPELSAELRASNPGIQPGFHMNKLHWNTILTDGSVSDKLLYELIDISYDLVVAGLTRKLKEELARMT
ncbi:MAG: MmcQ/YjbR family DNA-binding protein [Bacteroidota bacterium]